MFPGVPDVAIDLGSANTRIFASGRGILAETPSIIGGAFHPLRRGVVVDVGGAAALLEPLIARVRRFTARPRALACIPSDATSDERKALHHAARAAGARQVAIVAEPLAAAVGANLDVSSGYAQMLVDVGDGVTDIAVLRSGVVIANAMLPVGCSDIREALTSWLEKGRELRIDDGEADRLVREVCSLPPDTAYSWLRIRHASAVDSAGSGDLLGAVEPALERIVTFVDDFVRDLPNAVAVEIIESGACVTGGGANLGALVELLRERTGLEVQVAADPLHAVIRGAGRILTGRGANALWAAHG